ncbi:hypothetical protein FRB99_004094, partial [Tulasnella sp. 403]
MRSFLVVSSVILLCFASLGSTAKLAPRYPVCDAEDLCRPSIPGTQAKLIGAFFVNRDLKSVSCYYRDPAPFNCVYAIR